MDEEKRIEIVADVEDVIKFDDITIKHDEINRIDVANAKREIEELEAQRVAIDERLVALRKKVEYAEKVIEIADAKKIADAEKPSNEEVVTEESSGTVQEEQEISNSEE